MLPMVLGFACEQESNKDLTENKVKLEGSWDLIKYIPHKKGEPEWVEYGDSIIYQKHLTSDHFIWFKYDSKNGQILGVGGGSYTIEDNKYIENIEFFYPPGSSELGQAIPFDFTLKQNTWTHLGYAKRMAVNMESGKLEVFDSAKIEEIWKRTNAPRNEYKDLIGTWSLIAYRDSLNAEYMEYPDFVGYLKLITPTHFTWVYYDMDGDEIYAVGSGRYLFDGANYSESIDMIYPDNSGHRGSTIEFNTSINNNTWKHVGYLPNIKIDSNNGMIVYDSSLFLDEKWKLHETSVMDGIVF